ncbi:hypothetical protein B0H17DRAFT_1176828 [Mycena rosella]|uniref:Uncharacterized protein n=1 Tax=Mycena rosella TaxID=1033263 RepID=A0AAD7DXX0_MYCRO|nr:hypothetical protein B0H17DRAFT_1176828 [Mycena rosella]
MLQSSASSTPWMAIFPCTKDSPAGITSDLISNAQKLGAHAILAYTEAAVFSFSNLTDNTPPVSVLFEPSKIKFYDAAAMNKLAANITRDFDALRTNSSILSQTDIVLARIPAISANTSVADPATSTSSLTPSPTKKPSSAARLDARFNSVLLAIISASHFVRW